MTLFKLTHEDNGTVPNQICTICDKETEFNPNSDLCLECYQHELELHGHDEFDMDIELEDRGFFVPKAFDVDEFNANNSELYMLETNTKCRSCNGEIYANNIDAICDCDLPF